MTQHTAIAADTIAVGELHTVQRTDDATAPLVTWNGISASRFATGTHRFCPDFYVQPSSVIDRDYEQGPRIWRQRHSSHDSLAAVLDRVEAILTSEGTSDVSGYAIGWDLAPGSDDIVPLIAIWTGPTHEASNLHPTDLPADTNIRVRWNGMLSPRISTTNTASLSEDEPARITAHVKASGELTTQLRASTTPMQSMLGEVTTVGDALDHSAALLTDLGAQLPHNDLIAFDVASTSNAGIRMRLW